jgi:hypothetical protein
MYNILKLPAEEKRTLFRNTAQKMGVHEAIIEKDFWVCLVLDYLFHKSKYAEHLTFKGGTSLSKCFGLIKRFSEDIDLILDWRLLGYGIDEPWADRSKTKQDAFNKEANARAETVLINEFLPLFTADLSDIIGETAKVKIEKDDPQTVSFQYPQLFSTESILQSIRLEIGALAAWTPAVEKSITPYIFEYYQKLAQQKTISVLTSSAERTFWEKVTILHHEANRPEHLEMPSRYSRHYYDLNCISKTEYKTNALKRLDLLQKVVLFKMKFYPRAWAKYDEAVPGSIRLIPPTYRLGALKKDYESMVEMLFGEYPTFDEMISTIADLEKEINEI